MTAVTTPAAPRRRLDLTRLARAGLPVWVVVLVLVIALSIVDPAGFWSPANVASILTGAVVLGLVSLGQHLVVLSGGIDLSVGSMATLSCLLTALLINAYPIRTVPVLLAMLALGALVGAFHGALVTRARIAPFVVTLATFYLLQGIAFLISTTPVGRVTTQLSSLGLTQWGPIPEAFLVLLVAIIVVAFLIRRTVWGRHLYAAGGDSDAARSSGVPIGRTTVLAYVADGILAAAAGIMLAAEATVGSPTAGQGLELSAITVVVVGGVSLLGGRGSLVGTLGGIALLALLESSFTLLQLPATLTDLVRGVVILAAVAIFVARPRR